jgi:hypothetical protein
MRGMRHTTISRDIARVLSTVCAVKSCVASGCVCQVCVYGTCLVCVRDASRVSPGVSMKGMRVASGSDLCVCVKYCNCNCNCCHRHRDTSHDRQVPSPGGSDTQHDPRTTYRHAHTTSHVAALPEPSRDHATTHKPLSLPDEHTSYQRPTSSPIQLQLPSQITCCGGCYRTPIHTRPQPRGRARPPRRPTSSCPRDPS